MMAIPTIMPHEPTGLVEFREDGSLEIVLPWAASITFDQPTVRVGLDPAIPVAIDEDVMSLPRRMPTAPIVDQATQAVHRFSIMEKLVVMKALAAVATAAGSIVTVSAMPYHAPEKVHLQARNWATFANWLKFQAGDMAFVHVHVEVQRALRVVMEARQAVVYTPPRALPAPAEQSVLEQWDDVVTNLRYLAEAAPQMKDRRAGDVLHLPFTED